MLVYVEAFEKQSGAPLSIDQLAFKDGLRQNIEMRYQGREAATLDKIPSKSKLLELFPPDTSLG
jgi:hypothetical protein